MRRIGQSQRWTANQPSLARSWPLVVFITTVMTSLGLCYTGEVFTNDDALQTSVSIGENPSGFQKYNLVVQSQELDAEMAESVQGDASTDLLDAVLTPFGYGYLFEDAGLSILPITAMGEYFAQRAVTRAFQINLDETAARQILKTPGIISTMGRLEIYPRRGIIAIQDLPQYVDALGERLKEKNTQEDSVTL